MSAVATQQDLLNSCNFQLDFTAVDDVKQTAAISVAFAGILEGLLNCRSCENAVNFETVFRKKK
jgi:hypothetical protein